MEDTINIPISDYADYLEYLGKVNPKKLQRMTANSLEKGICIYCGSNKLNTHTETRSDNHSELVTECLNCGVTYTA